MLRGIDKINVEIALIAMAHNLKKFSQTLYKNFKYALISTLNSKKKAALNLII